LPLPLVTFGVGPLLPISVLFLKRRAGLFGARVDRRQQRTHWRPSRRQRGASQELFALAGFPE
jgi:hypothetical protein